MKKRTENYRKTHFYLQKSKPKEKKFHNYKIITREKKNTQNYIMYVVHVNKIIES